MDRFVLVLVLRRGRSAVRHHVLRRGALGEEGEVMRVNNDTLYLVLFAVAALLPVLCALTIRVKK